MGRAKLPSIAPPINTRRIASPIVSVMLIPILKSRQGHGLLPSFRDDFKVFCCLLRNPTQAALLNHLTIDEIPRAGNGASPTSNEVRRVLQTHSTGRYQVRFRIDHTEIRHIFRPSERSRKNLDHVRAGFYGLQAFCSRKSSRITSYPIAMRGHNHFRDERRVHNKASARQNSGTRGCSIQNRTSAYSKGGAKLRDDALNCFQDSGRGHRNLNHTGSALIKGMCVGQYILMLLELDGRQNSRTLRLLYHRFTRAALSHLCSLTSGCACWRGRREGPLLRERKRGRRLPLRYGPKRRRRYRSRVQTERYARSIHTGTLKRIHHQSQNGPRPQTQMGARKRIHFCRAPDSSTCRDGYLSFPAK